MNYPLMSITGDTNSVFFSGKRSFRSRRIVRTVLIRFALAATAFLAVGVGLGQPVPIAGYVSAIILIAGTAALTAGVALLTAVALGRVDRLTISERGVKYGDRFWKWARLRAFRARRNRPSEPIRLLIWKDADEGPGYFLVIDEPVSPQAAVDLIRRVQEYCSTNHPEVKCEVSC